MVGRSKLIKPWWKRGGVGGLGAARRGSAWRTLHEGDEKEVLELMPALCSKLLISISCAYFLLLLFVVSLVLARVFGSLSFCDF